MSRFGDDQVFFDVVCPASVDDQVFFDVVCPASVDDQVFFDVVCPASVDDQVFFDVVCPASVDDQVFFDVICSPLRFPSWHLCKCFFRRYFEPSSSFWLLIEQLQSFPL